VRDLASIRAESALRSVEDMVIDEFARAINDVDARTDAIHVWLAGFDADATVDVAAFEERAASANEPLRVWAMSAKPRLVQALADMNHVRSVAPELRRPAEAYSIASEVINAVGLYEAAADAYLARDFDGAGELVGQAHEAWRQMQARNGLAKYV
jgi:hypothetical protein